MWLHDEIFLGSWEDITKLVFDRVLAVLTMAAFEWASTVPSPAINDMKPRNYLRITRLSRNLLKNLSCLLYFVFAFHLGFFGNTFKFATY